MKLTKTEKAAVLLTLLFLAFTLGAHWGVGRVRDSFTISTQTGASARRTSSDASPADTALAGRTAEEGEAVEGEAAEGEAVEDEAAEGEAAASGKININTAGLSELMRLDGIGEKLAGRIIADREENGAFARIEDITRISGIGEGIFTGICEDITVE